MLTQENVLNYALNIMYLHVAQYSVLLKFISTMFVLRNVGSQRIHLAMYTKKKHLKHIVIM